MLDGMSHVSCAAASVALARSAAALRITIIRFVGMPGIYHSGVEPKH
jgi:hypothetical protein